MIVRRDLNLDILRFIILFLMIEGHTVRELLASVYKNSFIFSLHEFFHSVTAPAFLFLSGYLFFYTYESKGFGVTRFFNKLKTYIGIIIFGYALHLPFFSFKKTVKLWGTGIEKNFLNFDVLQCIGFSLLISLFLTLLFKKNFKYFSIFLFFFFLLGDRLFDWKNYPLFFKSFFSSEISNFPLFYYSIYFFTGVVFSGFKVKIKPFLVIVFFTGAVFLSFYPGYFFKAESDLLMLITLYGAVRLVKVKIIEGKKVLNFFLSTSRESLFIYIFHLIIVYGSVVNKGLGYYFRESLGVLESVLFFLIVFSLTYLCAYFVNVLRRDKIPFEIIKYGFYFSFLFSFFYREF